MVIGGGGREHAIIKKLKENPQVEVIYALPGNGGMADEAICTGISATDLDAIVAFAKGHPVDYAVVAPDDPLVLGCVDRLNELGIPCFGPKANAAIIEGSKVFSTTTSAINPRLSVAKKVNAPVSTWGISSTFSSICMPFTDFWEMVAPHIP